MDSFYFGHEELLFTGSNVTQLVHYAGSYQNGNYLGIVVNISYNDANSFDTISVQFTNPVLGHKKMVFQYLGSHVAKVIVAHSVGFSDSLAWPVADVYRYTYTGNNISQIIYGSSGMDSITYNCFSGSRNNNFAGNLSAFLKQEFIKGIDNDILLDIPFYANTNIVDSTDYGKYTTITDAAGRIVQRILVGTPVSDTTFYSY